MKIYMILKQWIETRIEDFDENLLQDVHDFIIHTFEVLPELKKAGETLLKRVNDKIEQRLSDQQVWFKGDTFDLSDSDSCRFRQV
jgi:hypothetical protein